MLAKISSLLTRAKLAIALANDGAAINSESLESAARAEHQAENRAARRAQKRTSRVASGHVTAAAQVVAPKLTRVERFNEWFTWSRAGVIVLIVVFILGMVANSIRPAGY